MYLYYKLERFYQNHRRYVKSRDDNQLHGRSGTPQSTCDPLGTSNGSAVAPCGYIANSMFNGVCERLRCECLAGGSTMEGAFPLRAVPRSLQYVSVSWTVLQVLACPFTHMVVSIRSLNLKPMLQTRSRC